ncbi:MAG: hypothetical protein RMZ69_03560 [Nostoc sp. ChiQUE01a]|nr:hypothetical protein [Nostoc sp. ChiQUE01a]
MGLVRFQSDNIAKSTSDWFINIFKKPPQNFLESLAGGHLKPLGIQKSNKVLNLFDKPLIESVQKRNQGFEHYVIELLQELKEKAK